VNLAVAGLHDVAVGLVGHVLPRLVLAVPDQHVGAGPLGSVETSVRSGVPVGGFFSG